MVVEDRLMVDHGAFKMREWRLQHFGFHLCISEKLDAHRHRNPVLAPPRHLSAPAAKGIAKSEFQRMKAVSAMQKAMPRSTRERSSFIIVYVQWDCTQMLLCFRTRQKLWCILWSVPTPPEAGLVTGSDWYCPGPSDRPWTKEAHGCTSGAKLSRLYSCSCCNSMCISLKGFFEAKNCYNFTSANRWGRYQSFNITFLGVHPTVSIPGGAWRSNSTGSKTRSRWNHQAWLLHGGHVREFLRAISVGSMLDGTPDVDPG